MDFRNLLTGRNLRFLALVILEVLICFIVASLVISFISGKSLGESYLGGAVIAGVLVTSYNWLYPQPRSG